jgi:FKBP-type peptidyl-prolyl cis-trans isomerase FklB
MLRPLIALSALGLAAAATVPGLLEGDFETLPPPANEVYAKLTASTTSLAEAVTKVEEATSGRVSSAAIDTTAGVLSMDVYTSQEHLEVVADLSGTVTSKTVIPRFPGDPVSGDWTETDTGLRYTDLVEGTGAMPPSSTSRVKVHYSGWFVNGKSFDSSVDRGRPAEFPLNGVIAGWTEGVGSMKVGGKRKLIIPYDLGYGERGGRGIPPRATLIFDVELLEIL